MLSQMIQDFDEANDAGKKDMFEEAAERMITAETRLAEAEAIIKEVVNLEDADGGRMFPPKELIRQARAFLKD